mgnify:CR=1 FL=1
MPKTPKLNGLAERMNRTIMERVRSMLSDSKLLKSYWAKAMLTTIYQINRSPSVPLKGDVPLWVWSGKDVSYKHRKVFGCLSYVHVALTTSQNHAYSWGTQRFDYRQRDILDKKVRSRDMVFMEDKSIED